MHNKTLERLRNLLERVTDARFREQLKKLIADEEARDLLLQNGGECQVLPPVVPI